MINHSSGARLRPHGAIICLAASWLVFLPGGFSRFLWPKVLILVIAVGWAWLAPAEGRLPAAVRWTILAGAAAFVLAAIASGNPMTGLAGRWPRFEGLPMLALYAGTLAAGARVLGSLPQDSTVRPPSAQRKQPEDGQPKDDGRWMTLYRAVSVAVLIVAFVSVLEAFGLRPLGGSTDVRPGATFGNATEQGLAGAMAAALLILPASRLRHPLLLAGTAAALVTVVVSGSRTAFAGLTIATLVVLYLLARPGRAHGASQLRRLWKRGAVPLLTLGALAVAVLMLPGLRERILSGHTVTGRWLLWEESLQLAMSHPVFGVGPGNFVDAIPAFHDLNWAVLVGTEFPADSPHFFPLQAWLSAGLAGLLAVMVFGSLLTYRILTRIRAANGLAAREAALASSLVIGIYGIGLLTHFTSPGLTPFVAFVAGGLLAAPLRRQEAPTPTAPAGRKVKQALAAAGIAVGLAFAGPAAAAEWHLATGTEAAANLESSRATIAFDGQRRCVPGTETFRCSRPKPSRGPPQTGTLPAAKPRLSRPDAHLNPRLPRSRRA